MGKHRMSWILLIVAGLLEACWAVGLKYTHGFTRPVPSLLVALAIIGSMVLLALAVRDLPIGPAYAVWVGIGIVGAVLAQVAIFGQPLRVAQIFFLMLLLVSIVGLKLTSD
jgi:quaternary ammonium compound-resistance protein SugE